MKVLYAIQGTGNGHIARAREIVPILSKMCELDLFISGSNSQVQLPHEVKFRSKGLSIFYDKSGGVSLTKTIANIRPKALIREIKELPVEKYDLIINDFEFISAHAALLKGVPCVGFGHQAAFRSAATPRPRRRDPVGELILKHYAPADSVIGLHFDRYAPSIHTPIIRSEVRSLTPQTSRHFTVYLPHYDDKLLISILTEQKDCHWHLFTKNVRSINAHKNVTLLPIDSKNFTQSLANSNGLVTGAGFESPAEAMFLGKKVLALPIRGQYEQKCNAKALKMMGVTVVKKIGKRFPQKLRTWIETAQPVAVDYPDMTEQILEHVLSQKEISQAVGSKVFSLPTIFRQTGLFRLG
ncbi:glycosyltransferase family protein [Rhodoflexus caldus]|uniref:glycosyltransferase family protein n=1 Tax=Rhodoflexus caldus TaxID=2891236 RepID=UPI00202AA7F6|nr:glycosyltransferase family protein [Rhodoflexus caldus]